MYDQLPSSHQALVDQGRIKQGMSKEAVFLAWGNPEIKADGEENSIRFERWTYTRLSPIYTTGFSGHYGFDGYAPYGYAPYGYAPYGYGYGRCRGYGYGYHNQVVYAKSKAASVDFKNDRVTRWQRGRLTSD